MLQAESVPTDGLFRVVFGYAQNDVPVRGSCVSDSQMEIAAASRVCARDREFYARIDASGEGLEVFKMRFVLASVGICMLVMSSTASAHSTVTIDPAGDIADTTAPYYDIVKAKIHATGDETGAHEAIVFSMKLTVPIPELSSDTFYGANWLLDTNTARVGPEYNVIVRWCTTATHPRCQPGVAHWEGALNDFAAGGTQTYVSRFNVEGDSVTLWLDPERIGSPREFDWAGATRSRGAQPIPEDETDVASFRR